MFTHSDERDELLTRVLVGAVERQQRPKESSGNKEMASRKESKCRDEKGRNDLQMQNLKGANSYKQNVSA